MSSASHRGDGPLLGVHDWPGWPLISLHAAGHPMRAEELRPGRPVRAARRDPWRRRSPGHRGHRGPRGPHDPGRAAAGDGGRHHSEFRYGTFSRSFRLPATADETKIRALYGSGILEITVSLAGDAAGQARRQVPVHVNHHISPT